MSPLPAWPSWWAAVTTSILLVGCASPPSGSTPTATPVASDPASPTNAPAAAPTPRGDETVRRPGVPVAEIHGRVRSLNAQAQFVVVELIFSPLPSPGRRLDVYRDDRKVGELRASRWSQGALLAADIIKGEVKPGDEVRGD